MRKALIGLLALLWSSQAFAAIETKSFNAIATGISNLGLNSSRQFTLTVAGYSQLTVWIDYTRGGGAAATDIRMTCKGGWSASILGPLDVQKVNDTSGQVTSASGATWINAVSASETIRIIITPINDTVIQCTITGTGANVNDTISVYARAGVL